MRTVELNDDEWVILKRRLMTMGAEEALKCYEPPVKLTHGAEYITYEKEGNEEPSTSPSRRKETKMIPKLTNEQRSENLEKARAARKRRAAILKSIADGSYSVVDVLDMALEDETVSRMKVFTLIKAAPGYGFARTQQTMNRLHIAESRRIKGLGANQRAALVELFGGAK